MSKAGPIDYANTDTWGHVLIRDKNTGEVLVDSYNSINFENLSIAIANSLADNSIGVIQEMHFGNGGSTVSGTGAITYFPPNVTGTSADLYNDTYFKVVNNQSPLDLNTAENYIEVNHLVNTVYTDIVVVCTLDYNEPSAQQVFDDSTDLSGTYTFDEIGLKTYNAVPGNGLLITHVVFNPIQKSLNRLIEIQYTLRISMV